MQPETTRRETIRSRTTMSHAFEGAIRQLLIEEGNLNSKRGDIATWAAERIDRTAKTVPTWTVSKRAEKTTKRRKGGRR